MSAQDWYMYATDQKKIQETIQLLTTKKKFPWYCVFSFTDLLFCSQTQFNENGHSGYFVSKKNLHYQQVVTINYFYS